VDPFKTPPDFFTVGRGTPPDFFTVGRGTPPGFFTVVYLINT